MGIIIATNDDVCDWKPMQLDNARASAVLCKKLRLDHKLQQWAVTTLLKFLN